MENDETKFKCVEAVRKTNTRKQIVSYCCRCCCRHRSFLSYWNILCAGYNEYIDIFVILFHIVYLCLYMCKIESDNMSIVNRYLSFVLSTMARLSQYLSFSFSAWHFMKAQNTQTHLPTFNIYTISICNTFKCACVCCASGTPNTQHKWGDRMGFGGSDLKQNTINDEIIPNVSHQVGLPVSAMHLVLF